jgi:hypothetical protein
MNCKNLMGALLKAKQEMDKLRKDKTNPHFKSKYADLAGVLEVIDGPLAKHGLVLYQDATLDEVGRLVVTSTVFHVESGEELTAALPIPLGKADAQSIGSAITYGRRYLAVAQCGLAPEDDDGNAASRERSTQTRPAPPSTSPDEDVDFSGKQASMPDLAKKIEDLIVKIYGPDGMAEMEAQVVGHVTKGKKSKVTELDLSARNVLANLLEKKLAKLEKEAAA